MSIILDTERRYWRTRFLVLGIYLLLGLGGASMVYPFLITLSASMTNKFEYNRFMPCPRSLYDRADRFVRSLVTYFPTPPKYVLPGLPASWSNWIVVGDNPKEANAFAAAYLAVQSRPEELARWRLAAADYAEFNMDYDIQDSVCTYDDQNLAWFLRHRYERIYLEKHPLEARSISSSELRTRALAELRSEFEVPFQSFFDVQFKDERRYPMHHLSWDYPNTPQAKVYQNFKDAYRRLVYTPGAEGRWRAYAQARGVKEPVWPVERGTSQWEEFIRFAGKTVPATQTMPFLLKGQWLAHLNRLEVKKALGLDLSTPFTAADYDRLFGGSHKSLLEIPFPVPSDAPPALQSVWEGFVRNYYPRRLVTVNPNPQLQSAYQESLRATYRTIQTFNTLNGTAFGDFTEIPLKPYEPTGDWRKFVGTLSPKQYQLRSAESAYQAFLLRKYGSADAVNKAYGWTLSRIEEASPAVSQAVAATFFQNEWRFFWHDILKNYAAVFDYMALRGSAFVNTVIFISISILLSLIVNPLAAYALSRFRLRWAEQILLFLLATMAFPAAVTAIPSFLLIRDMQLLNTFYALFLPSLANGMAIFILKCFFDGLPKELYEAANIDGAQEWQIFLNISLPLTSSILAINALNAFIAAYNSWEWALIVCQKETYWTVAVWLYQLSQTMTEDPWIIMAGFVAASIPTALVFIFCQKIILRGIVIPSMK